MNIGIFIAFAMLNSGGGGGCQGVGVFGGGNGKGGWMDVAFPWYFELSPVAHLEGYSDYYFLCHYQMLPTNNCTQHLNIGIF